MPLLSSCGGGGGAEGSDGNPTLTNTAPRVSVPIGIDLFEGSRLSANVQVTDAEGDLLRFNFVGADAKFFVLTGTGTGGEYVLQAVKPLDFENPEDANADNHYDFDIVVGDGRATTTGHVVVRVVNVAGVTFAEEQGMAAILGINNNEMSGNSVGFAGDLDGDGMSEVLLGSSRRESPQPVAGVISRPGSVFVVSGASVVRSNSGKIQLLDQAMARSVELTWPATVSNQVPEFGHRVLGAADIDGDGLGEVAVSPLRWDSVGVVDIVRGSRVADALRDAATSPRVDVGSAPGLRIRGEFIGNSFGFSLARMPDMDGDSRDELIISAPSSGVSRVYLVFSSTLRDALAAGGDFAIASAIGNGGAVRFDNTRLFGGFYYSVASAGDFDGDDIPDLVIGERGNAALGYVHVVFGRAILQARRGAGLLPLENLEQAGSGVTLVGEFTLDAFGSEVAGIGDFNHDGFDDIAVGASNSPADSANVGSVTFKGAVFVLFGSNAPFQGPLSVGDLNTGRLGFIIRSNEELGKMGAKLAAAGDINADGFADFFIMSPGSTLKVSDAAGPVYPNVGRIDLVLGTSATLDMFQFDVYSGRIKIIPFPSNQYGADMSAAGDVDGDGLNDLLSSATGTLRCDPAGPIATGGAFYLSGAKIQAAVNGVLDLGDHLFGMQLPSHYPGDIQLTCRTP